MSKLLKNKPSTYLTHVTVTAFSMIQNKDWNAYDLEKHLRKHKGKAFQSPLELISEKGHNLLHEIVDKGRVSMFIVIPILGWWGILAPNKVPEDSSSEHKGCTAEEIIKKKKSPKQHEEFKNYSLWEENLTPLMKACRLDDTEKVRYLLNNSSEAEEIYYKDTFGWNALFWAVACGSKDILLLLLDAGLDTSVKTKKGETLLHIAALFGRTNLLKVLLEDERCKLDPATNDISMKTPYDKIAENGDVESFEELTSCGYEPTSGFIVGAAYHGREECIEYCLETLKLDVNCLDIYNRTALHRACENKKENIAKLLISHGAKMSLETCTKRNLLHILAEAGDANMAIEFLELLKKEKKLAEMINQKDRYNGVDLCFLIRGRDRGRDAWHYVEVTRSNVPVFLKKTRQGNVDVALFGTVVKSGWGVNPDQENVTFIEDMFKERRLNQEADEDMTPLHIAVFKGHQELVKLLLANGAKPNETDKFGLTPLMLAAAMGELELVKQLEAAGASFQDESKDGKTPLKLAEDNEQDVVIQYIRGMSYFQISENFVRAKLDICREELGTDKLDNVRAQGGDVQRHIVNILRDLKIDINVYLAKIGSSPITEATED